jgi:hypothetical protein
MSNLILISSLCLILSYFGLILFTYIHCESTEESDNKENSNSTSTFVSDSKSESVEVNSSENILSVTQRGAG